MKEKGKKGRKVIFALMVLVGLGLAVHQTVIYFRYFDWEHFESMRINEFDGDANFDLSAEDRLYWLGNEEEDGMEDRFKAMAEAFPNDPAVYWRYAGVGEIPEDFRETVERIAPENGYFAYMEAVQLARKAYDCRRNVEYRKREPIVQSSRNWSHRFAVPGEVDEYLVGEVLMLVKSAVEKPRFEDYFGESRKEILKRIPAHVDWVTQRRRSLGRWSQVENLNPIFVLLRYEASEAVERGDKQRFLELFEVGQLLARRIFESSDHLYSASLGAELIYRDAVFYQEGAQAFGLSKMLETLRERERTLDRFFGFSRYDQPDHPLDDLASRAFLGRSNQGRYLEGVYAVKDHKPMARTLDSFVAWQMSLKIFWIGLAIVAVLLVYGRFQSKELRVQSRGLVRSRMTVRVMFCASILPVLLVGGIYLLKSSLNQEPDPG